MYYSVVNYNLGSGLGKIQPLNDLTRSKDLIAALDRTEQKSDSETSTFNE